MVYLTEFDVFCRYQLLFFLHVAILGRSKILVNKRFTTRTKDFVFGTFGLFLI